MSHPLVPEGEKLRRALRFIGDERVARPDAPVAQIIEAASVRFDLSPAEEEWLLTVMKKLPAPEDQK